MNVFKAWPLIFGLSVSPAWADDFPLKGMQFNPAARMNISSLNSTATGGFLLNASNGIYDVIIKGTPIKVEAAAKEMANVEMANIRNLYSTRGSPYAGQISEVIQCEKAYLPQVTSIKIRGTSVDALLAGATARKLFGACNHDQIEYFAEYFNFYDHQGARNIDVRVFTKFAAVTPERAKKISRQIKIFSEKLLVEILP